LSSEQGVQLHLLRCGRRHTRVSSAIQANSLAIQDIYPATLFACARVNGRRLRAP
jgi:hypothetical protein